MTRTDQKILFTALAFLAVLMKGEDTERKDEAQKVVKLAEYIEAFCLENIGDAMPQPPEASAEETDAIINRHIHDLKQRHETRLPDDKKTLIRFYDRLQQRKAWRMQREFYATATEAKLADLVLRYLDEEIEDGEVLA